MMDTRTNWMSEGTWGIFCHYLGKAPGKEGCGGQTAEDWNAQVDAFDVRGLVEQLKSTRCKWFFLTLGQNSGHYLSPNATYDQLTGICPSKCSRRDIVLELAELLEPAGIRLGLYLPSGAPAQDPEAMTRLGWEWGYACAWPKSLGETRTGKRLADFQVRWEAVAREWSLRYGTRVSAWWIDGCYFAEEMYRHEDAPNFGSFAAALRAGNPSALLAFNQGVFNPVIRDCPEEDFTAGEVNRDFPIPTERFTNGAQTHVLTYLGESWCWGEAPTLNTDFVSAYVQQLRRVGASVTFDVPIEKNGLIRAPFLEQLQAIR